MKPNGAGHDVRSSLSSIAHHLLYMEVKLEDVEGKRHCRMRPQHAVHLIPVVLILCALILWLSACSNRSSYSLIVGDGVSGEFVRVISVEKSLHLDANGMVEETSNGGSWSNGSHAGGLRSEEVMSLGNHRKRGS